MTYTYAIGEDATVYVHTAEWNGTLNIGYFTAIRNGAVLWRTRHGPCHALHGEPVLGADNTLYQGFYTGMDHEGLAILSAWNLTDGKMKWATQFPTRFDHNYISFSAKVSVASDGSLRVATQDRTGDAESDYLNTLHAVDTRGDLLWNCSLPSGKLPGWVDGLPSQVLLTMGPDDVTFARVNETKIAAVSAEGNPLWTESITSRQSDILQSFMVHVNDTMFAVIQHAQANGLATSSIYAVNLKPILGESEVLVV